MVRKSKPQRTQDDPGATQRNEGSAREDSSIYQREHIPVVGANFSALQTVKPIGSMLNSGMSLSGVALFTTMVHMPVDRLNSFDSKMAEVYAEIRESNSGASNYTAKHIGMYTLKLMALRAWAIHFMRALAALRSTMPNSADSPQVLAAATGVIKYKTYSSQMADLFNDVAIIVKDIENLPVPPFPVFERQKFLYERIFADSPREKPALITFQPMITFDPALDENGEYEFTHTALSNISGPPQWLTTMQTMYESIVNDPVLTILRGDLRRAYGTLAYQNPLSPMLTQPLRIDYVTDEVRSQIENAGLLCYGGAGGPPSLAKNASGIWQISLNNGGLESIGLKSSYADQLVNYRGKAPSTADMLQITRFMPIAEWDDGVLELNKLLVVASSGDTIANVQLLTDILIDNATLVDVDELQRTAQKSLIQSDAMAAMRDMAYASGVIDGFPMLINDPADPKGYIWDLDNFAIVSSTELHAYHERAIRSLFSGKFPRGEFGRIERRP